MRRTRSRREYTHAACITLRHNARYTHSSLLGARNLLHQRAATHFQRRFPERCFVYAAEGICCACCCCCWVQAASCSANIHFRCHPAASLHARLHSHQPTLRISNWSVKLVLALGWRTPLTARVLLASLLPPPAACLALQCARWAPAALLQPPPTLRELPGCRCSKALCRTLHRTHRTRARMARCWLWAEAPSTQARPSMRA